MKSIKNTGLIISLSLVFLFNPAFNLIDILPDFISYILLIYAIGTASEHVPYLAECKEALTKLAVLSLLKFPAMLIMFSNMHTGRDIVPLFTLIFATLDIIFLIPAINNGAAALYYIGERTDAVALISAFPIDKKGAHTMSTDSLKRLTTVFVVVKSALNFLPELCLLTFEDRAIMRRLSNVYPMLLVLSMLATLLIGCVWLNRMRKYVKAVRATQTTEAAIASLAPDTKDEETTKKNTVKKINASLTMLAIASLFSFDIVFNDISRSNILPRFIYGIFILFVVLKFAKDKKEKSLLIGSASALTVFSAILHSVSTSFFKTYDYEDIYYLSTAKKAYNPIKLLATLETMFMLLLLSVCAYIFIRLVRDEICGRNGDGFGRLEADRMRAMTVKSVILFSMPAFIGILKCVNIYLKSHVIISYNESSLNPLTYSPLPWLATLITLICILFVAYSFYFTSELKGEVKFKYSID